MRGRLLLLLLLLLSSNSVQGQTQNCIASAIAGGTANALTIPQLPCSAASALVLVTASAANTGTATLAITGVLPVAIQKGIGVPLTAGDIPGAGFTMMLVNAGQTWKMLNPANGAGGAPGGVTDAVQFNAGSLAFGGTSVIANAILGTDGSGIPNETQTLPSTVQGNITALGTIGSGTWNGTTVAVAHGGTGLISGTAGGILAFSASGTLVSTPALTSGLPVIGQGSSIPTVGTVSGNTTKFGTVSGSFTAGNFIKADASGNLVDAGSTTGTINNSTIGNVTYYSGASTLSGQTLSSLIDTAIGSTQNEVLIRGGANWGITKLTYPVQIGSIQTFTAGTTAYYGVGCGSSVTEALCYIPAPTGMTLVGMYGQADVVPGAGQTDVLTFRKNAVDSAVTCTISGAGTSKCNDTSHTSMMVAGDVGTVKVVLSGSAATANFNVGLLFTIP